MFFVKFQAIRFRFFHILMQNSGRAGRGTAICRQDWRGRSSLSPGAIRMVRTTRHIGPSCWTKTYTIADCTSNFVSLAGTVRRNVDQPSRCGSNPASGRSQRHYHDSQKPAGARSRADTVPTRPGFALVTFAVLRTSARIFPYIERQLLPFTRVSKHTSSFAIANVRLQADIGAR